MSRRDCALDLWVRPDEQCVALAAGFRLFQRYRGHRYSVDDMLVGHLAGTRAERPARALDLGCGLGSVLLMLAWRFPGAEFVGIEAQPEHVALARRNVLLNGCGSRVRIVAGDMREARRAIEGGDFDLVTGTPPYFDPRAATVCSDPQRAHAQWELRGGIETYATAASWALGEQGTFVTCASADNDRTFRALEAAGLRPCWQRDVLPRPGKRPFLALWVAGKRLATLVRAEPLLLREADGARTPEHIAIRQWFGLPCSIR
ncbi:MAG: tRNA1(Val) (adenine(37)-N6)-methyltransferase [Myxococcota bacterium]